MNKAVPFLFPKRLSELEATGFCTFGGMDFARELEALGANDSDLSN
jgi:hypothetical protein